MKTLEKVAAVVLVLLLCAVGYGLGRTGGPMYTGRLVAVTPRDAAVQSAVDQTPLLPAHRLAGMATSADEQPFAQDALRIPDPPVTMHVPQSLRASPHNT